MNQTPNDCGFFSHFGQVSPLILLPHFLQCIFTPTTSWEGVLNIFIIKIATKMMPIAIPIKTSTMYHDMMQTGIKIFDFL